MMCMKNALIYILSEWGKNSSVSEGRRKNRLLERGESYFGHVYNELPAGGGCTIVFRKYDLENRKRES